MTTLFFVSFILLVLAELIKGLSANGTPPILQKLSWQIHLAHFMWSNIVLIRIILIAALIYFAWNAPAQSRLALVVGTILLGLVWGGIYWIFNRYWVGKYKFLPITTKVFKGADENEIDLSLQVLGVDMNGEQKAYPVNMTTYHHQITDEIGGHPIWVTYCGLCRSGRVYDILFDGKSLDFTLVGAITYNAVFSDNDTGSWWRQETGECAKGARKGHQLDDIPTEQMSLEQWLTKHPDSKILQYDKTFERKYNFITKMTNYEVSVPRWYMWGDPSFVLGVEVNKHPRAYDWTELHNNRLVMDDLGDTPLLLMTDDEGSSAFVYDRSVGSDVLEFEMTDKGIKDKKTGSTWDYFGRCVSGKLKGKELKQIQSYRQYLRSWISFHEETTFYNF